MSMNSNSGDLPNHPPDDEVLARLSLLDSNLKEQIEVMTSLRGTEYSAVCLKLFTSMQKTAELTRIAYDALNSISPLTMQESKHVLEARKFVDILSRGIVSDISFLQSILILISPEKFKDLNKDVIALHKRVNKDYFGVM